MRDYELTFIISAELTGAKEKKVLDNIEKTIETLGGKLGKKDEWGKKRLAYPIKKKTEGVYFLFDLSLPSSKVASLDRELEINEDVLRHLIVKD